MRSPPEICVLHIYHISLQFVSGREIEVSDLVTMLLCFCFFLMLICFSELFKDALNEYAYSAELAGLKYGFKNSIYGIQVSSM